MAWPSSRYKTATNGGSWTPADMNGVQDQYVRTAGVEADDLEQDVTEALGITTTASGHGGAAVRRGKCIIPTEESRSNTSFGTLTTPDIVEDIVLPTDGLIAICYMAMWKESVLNAADATIYIGANELQLAHDRFSTTSGISTGVHSSAANIYKPLSTTERGLPSSGEPAEGTAYGGHVTTGQIVGFTDGDVVFGGPVYVFAAAGTYDVSVQFKATSGSVTAKERKLWVWTIAF